MKKRKLLSFLIFIFITTNGWQLYTHNKSKFQDDYRFHKAAFEEIVQYISSEAEKYEGANYLSISKDVFWGYYYSVSYTDSVGNLYQVPIEDSAIQKRLYIPLRLLRYNSIRYDYDNQEVKFIAYIWEYNRSITYRFGWIYSPLQTESQVKERHEPNSSKDKFVNAGGGWYYYKTLVDVSEDYNNVLVSTVILKKICSTSIFLAVIILIAVQDYRRSKREDDKIYYEAKW